jgi:hypothetical protein
LISGASHAIFNGPAASSTGDPDGSAASGERMASEHSYSITLSNNRTEKAAIDYLMAEDPHLWAPTPASRRLILDGLGLPQTFSRAFDLVRVSEPFDTDSGLSVDEIDSITLVELKTTKKYLPELPKGFFFGATHNEFDLARQLGDRYNFCFVCLHPESLGYRLLTLAELEPLIRTKRTQYQINL